MSDDTTLHDKVITPQKAVESEEDKPNLPTLEKLPAVIESIKPKQTKNGTRASFCFGLRGDFKDRRAWGSVPDKTAPTPESKLYQWISAILGKPLEIGEGFTLGSLIGQPVYIVIKDSDETDKNNNPYQNVVEVVFREGEKEEINSTKTKTNNTSTKKTTETSEDVKDVLDEKVTGKDEEKEEPKEPKEEKKQESKKENTKEEASDEISEDEMPF